MKVFIVFAISGLIAIIVVVGRCTKEMPTNITVSSPSQTINMAVGQELDITLSTVGPGSYDTIPGTSSPVVKFLDGAVVPPYLPSGPTQRFRFLAQTAGQAVIILGQSGRSPGLPSDTVRDIVIVH